MSKKLVVDAEWLLELLPENYPFPPQTVEQMIQEQEDYTLAGREVIRPLTPAQERAGDEEWVVVRKDRLGDLMGPFLLRDVTDMDKILEYLTTPDAEKGGGEK